jgi:hypothetical protein
LLGILGAGLALDLVQLILEYGAGFLEAGGADVGHVVGDYVHVQLLRFQAGLGNP